MNPIKLAVSVVAARVCVQTHAASPAPAMKRALSLGAANVEGVGALGPTEISGGVLSGDVLTVGDSGRIGGSIT